MEVLKVAFSPQVTAEVSTNDDVPHIGFNAYWYVLRDMMNS